VLKEIGISMICGVLFVVAIILAFETGLVDSALDAYAAYKCEMCSSSGDFAGMTIYCGER